MHGIDAIKLCLELQSFAFGWDKRTCRVHYLTNDVYRSFSCNSIINMALASTNIILHRVDIAHIFLLCAKLVPGNFNSVLLLISGATRFFTILLWIALWNTNYGYASDLRDRGVLLCSIWKTFDSLKFSLEHLLRSYPHRILCKHLIWHSTYFIVVAESFVAKRRVYRSNGWHFRGSAYILWAKAEVS